MGINLHMVFDNCFISGGTLVGASAATLAGALCGASSGTLVGAAGGTLTSHTL